MFFNIWFSWLPTKFIVRNCVYLGTPYPSPYVPSVCHFISLGLASECCNQEPHCY